MTNTCRKERKETGVGGGRVKLQSLLTKAPDENHRALELKWLFRDSHLYILASISHWMRSTERRGLTLGKELSSTEKVPEELIPEGHLPIVLPTVANVSGTC